MTIRITLKKNKELVIEKCSPSLMVVHVLDAGAKIPSGPSSELLFHLTGKAPSDYAADITGAHKGAKRRHLNWRTFRPYLIERLKERGYL